MPILARITTAKTKRPIPPFGEPASMFSYCDVNLDALQREEAEAAGLTLVDVNSGEPCPPDTSVITTSDTLFSRALLLAGLEQSQTNVRQVVLGNDTPLQLFMTPLSAMTSRSSDGQLLPLFFGEFDGKVVDAESEPELWIEDAGPFVVDDMHSEDDRVAPYGPPPHLLRIPATPLLGGRITHWLHALNLGLAWTLLLRRRHGALGRKNAILGKAKIHPTALVEGSVIADGVEIEAGATVLNSYLGPRAKIADHAIFVRCAVGQDCHTLIDTQMRRVIAFSGSTLANLGTADLLLGRKIFITTGVSFFHPGPRKDIYVDGENTRRPVLGGAVGHAAILGARTLLAAGQAVPAGVTVVGRPDEAISRMTDEGLARAHAQHGNPLEDA